MGSGHAVPGAPVVACLLDIGKLLCASRWLRFVSTARTNDFAADLGRTACRFCTFILLLSSTQPNICIAHPLSAAAPPVPSRHTQVHKNGRDLNAVKFCLIVENIE